MKRFLLLILLGSCFTGRAQQQLFWFIGNYHIGFKDAKGHVVIKPVYARAENFSEGLACVGKGASAYQARYGFINPAGQYVIQPQFNAAGSFREGVACVMKGNKWGYINKKGQWVIKPSFELCYNFTNGYAQAKKNGKWGIINKKGSFVVQPVYYAVTNAGDSILGVCTQAGAGWEIIGLDGNKKGNATFSKIKDFSNGMAPASADGNTYGYIDPSGRWLIPATFIDAEPFSDGLAAVENTDGKWGFIDLSAKTVIKPQFAGSGLFRQGIAMVEKDGEYLYINKKGATLARTKK